MLLKKDTYNRYIKFFNFIREVANRLQYLALNLYEITARGSLGFSQPEQFALFDRKNQK